MDGGGPHCPLPGGEEGIAVVKVFAAAFALLGAAIPTWEWIAAAVKIAVAVGFIMVAVPMLVWLERKLIADFQARVGPSRVGPFGLLQSFADGIKLLAKESIIPAEVDKLLYYVGPITVMIPALAVAAVVPFGAPVELFGHRIDLVIADLPVGILFVLALTSLGVYGIVLSGWASNNKYSLLGGLRSAAQMVSYELPMGLTLIAGLMIAGYATPNGIFSMSLSQIVDAQSGWFWNWAAFNPRFLFLGLLALIAFYICGLAETNRAPFDLPEAETELIGGYHTEYGGLKWSMFFLGEYAAMLNVSAVATTVFLGGWHAPYPDTLLFPQYSIGYMLQGILWFGLKIFAIIVLYIHLRATLPRLRYDQLMRFTWKGMLPGAVALVLAVAAIQTIAFPSDPPAILAAPIATTPPGAQPGPAVVPGASPSPVQPGGTLPPGLAPGVPQPGGLSPGSPAPRAVPGRPGGRTAPATPTPRTSPGGRPAPQRRAAPGTSTR
jgi:NADH-quinone oxidoreductase subunit H